MSHFKLKNYDINKLTDSEFTKYKKNFRSEKKPVKLYDLTSFYKQMIENITGNNLNIIVKGIPLIIGVQITKYVIDIKIICDFYFLSIRYYYNYNYDYN